MKAQELQPDWPDDEVEKPENDIGGKRKETNRTSKSLSQIVFEGEPFTASSVVRLRDRLLVEVS